jgi:hypothetical protein
LILADGLKKIIRNINSLRTKKMEVSIMFDEKLWEMAREQAIKEYEEEEGSWEEADKDEKEDWVFSTYIRLKNDKGVTMNRIDNITKFAQKKAEEKIAKENETMQRIEAYKEQVRALKPRIDELLIVGNACLEHGIELDGRAWGGHEGYDTHQFFSNSWSHLTGFVREYDQTTRKISPLTKVGKLGGGACDWNLTTDGVNINVSGGVEYVLKYFLDEFDEFETEFYKYVDKVTA